ncbi:hypothetical protein VNO78_25668 [Psophocarpus tetragonolobus]|uniref:Uncharacterized protein n=1 Tax=Psophocarpus tetragonolobus TaxID=3891 RepID=A0AAN9SAJ5_PSOTE
MRATDTSGTWIEKASQRFCGSQQVKLNVGHVTLNDAQTYPSDEAQIWADGAGVDWAIQVDPKLLQTAKIGYNKETEAGPMPKADTMGCKEKETEASNITKPYEYGKWVLVEGEDTYGGRYGHRRRSSG